MPGWWGHLDDPWGVVWRLKNLVSGFSLRRSARFLVGYSREIRHEHPVFIVGAPRSGTTMVFHLVRRGAAMASLPGEGHNVWRMYHHPRYSGWDSDAVGKGEVRFGEHRFVNAYFYSWVGRQRFVEKTPENSLRVAYLLDLFPDARFIAVHRNPCDVISSLIRGWRRPDGRFRSYYVPEKLSIQGYPHPRRWCFVLIEGWRELATATIPEIALAQWSACVEGIARGRELVPAERWVDVHLEALAERPRHALARVARLVGAEDALDELRACYRDLAAAPPNAASPPVDEKWRRETPQDIRPLLPRIAAAAPASGYEVDADTGAYRVL